MKWSKQEIENKRTVWFQACQGLFGILFAVGLLLILIKPDSRPALLLLAVSGGGTNLLQGARLYRQPKGRNQGMSMMLLGAVIGILGIWLALMRANGN